MRGLPLSRSLCSDLQKQSSPVTTPTYDYIIVGSGSSGATLASRLTEDPATCVLLLEAGKPKQNDFWVKTPVGVAKILWDNNYVWPSKTVPQKGLLSQEIYWPHGKLPGGSSSVNGMIFVRGEAQAYDDWAAEGCNGWSYQDCLPYFKRLESYPGGDDAYRGKTGPISVTSLRDGEHHVLSTAFIAACQEAGIPLVEDYNAESSEGVSFLQLSTKNGQRCSTARSYLRIAQGRANLDFQTEAHVTRVLFEGKTAIGVEYSQGGQLKTAHARGEVVLSGGPIKTPHILELSGVGQVKLLQGLGVPVVHDAPNVGENLSDHLQARITFECSQRVTINEVLGSKWRTLLMGANYLRTRQGFMATPSATAHAQAKTRPEQTRPEVKIQIHLLSGPDRYSRDPFPGFQVGFFQLRPKSRGWLHAHCTDPFVDPTIEPNYLAHADDSEAMLEALRLSRKVVDQGAMKGYAKRETRPGIDVQDDAGLLHYIKECGQTSWHPIGTCRMGADAASVVDPQLRVRGLQRLRVIDSSVMPSMPSSNTNAGSIMIGEKGADLLRSASVN